MTFLNRMTIVMVVVAIAVFAWIFNVNPAQSAAQVPTVDESEAYRFSMEKGLPDMQYQRVTILTDKQTKCQYLIIVINEDKMEVLQLDKIEGCNK